MIPNWMESFHHHPSGNEQLSHKYWYKMNAIDSETKQLKIFLRLDLHINAS